MLEDVSKEEYEEALIGLEKAKQDLFNIRFAMATTKDEKELNKLNEEEKKLKEDFRKNNRKKNLYEMYKRGRVYK